jgi:putative transposase
MLVGELAHRLRVLVRRICEGLEVEILRGVISKDHVHLLVSAPPDISPAEIMRQAKGKTSLKIFEELPHVKKRYWGRHFWARGYFCVTAGELTKEMFQEYLEHHFKRKPEDGFDIEPAL